MNKAAQRILAVATRLFAERGFEGTSVRAICTDAEVNLNAVSYHFGGKRALYQAVINDWGEDRLAGAQRVLGTPPQDAAALQTRLLIFAEETLVTLLARPEALILLFTEFQQGFRNCDRSAVESLASQQLVLMRFLKEAQEGGLLREDLDLDIVAGTLLERLNHQVLYADNIAALSGKSIRDAAYRQRWCEQNISLLLHGAAVPAQNPAQDSA